MYNVHLNMSSKYWSSTNRMSNRQSHIFQTINLFSDKIGSIQNNIHHTQYMKSGTSIPCNKNRQACVQEIINRLVNIPHRHIERRRIKYNKIGDTHAIQYWHWI